MLKHLTHVPKFISSQSHFNHSSYAFISTITLWSFIPPTILVAMKFLKNISGLEAPYVEL